MKIVLNEVEIKLAKYIGKARYENARNNNITDQKMGDQSCGFVDINGMGGELAACRAFNRYPDLTIVAADMLPGFDFIHGKKKVDVKTTEYKSGKLLATMKTKVTAADVYLLVVGTLPEYDVIGWIAADDLIREENIGDLGKGLGYMVDQDRLTLI